MSHFYLALPLLWCFSTGAVAQTEFRYDEQADRQFTRALSLFTAEQYEEAAHAFDSLAHQMPIHQRTTAAYLMEAKALLRLRHFDRSVSILESLLAQYPYTSYGADIRYTLAVDYMMERRFTDAAQLFIQAMETAKDSLLGRRIEESLITLADEHLNAATLNQLRLQASDSDVKDLLILKTAEKYLRENTAGSAQLLVDERLKQNRKGKYRKAMEELFARDVQRTGRRIGVVLPLMTRAEGNGVGSIAREILDGMNFAAAEFSSTAASSGRLTLDVRETGRDSVATVRAVEELGAAKDVVCIIGPLFSNLVAACAPIVDREHLPLITPTATSNALAASGKYVFQAHPDFATRGRVMARYAVRERGYQTLAMLASTDPTGAAVAESFSQEAQRLGARVVAMESFPHQANDIREQCMAIRRSALNAYPAISFAKKPARAEIEKLLRAGVPRRRIDSLIAVGGSMQATMLLGPEGIRIADSLHIKLSPPTTDVENLNVPIVSIDALFVAIDDAEEIGVVGSQLNYFNIKAALLGNNEWYDPNQLDAQKQYVNGIVFASDTYVDERAPEYAAFARAYRNAGGKQPTKYTLIGYDVLNLVLSQIRDGKGTRESLWEALSNVRGYKGIHSSITFSNGRVNSGMHILQYIKGDVKKIGESTLNE